MSNFTTFQEQEYPCITAFFDKKQNVPNSILQLFERQKGSLLFFDSENSPQSLLKWLINLVHQNESFIYGDPKSIEFENILHLDLQKAAQRISIQKDNFFKIAMIFMRIRSNSPIIIMGQSGIGKTALIEILSLIMDAKFVCMTVHSGIKEIDLIQFMDQNISQLKVDEKIILFFDEVNTNKMISGLFKEILVDRHLKGVRLPPNVIPIAAINPYKLKTDKQKEMINLQIHGGIKKELVDRIKNTDLEYMVEPIPESMYSFIWNFDKLSKKCELSYIKQMVLIKQSVKSKKYPDFGKQDWDTISLTIQFSQNYLREEMGYQSACSLRDVTRFLKILFWFTKNLKIFQEQGLNIKGLIKYSVCLSFYINYCVRLPLYEARKKFLRGCAKQLKITEEELNTIIYDVITFLINQTEVPDGIVKNFPLKQNIFTLFVAIMNKIPVILIGPPGSSKTLSQRILIQSMKGKESKSPFFKKFKALLPLFYQGHIQSTSERVLEVFKDAEEKQNKIEIQKEKKNYLSLVYMEEIGLAEISPFNPLKVLHSTLEKPKIAVSCISNWPLDQSKMNRMLSVFRLDVNVRELNEIICCIEDQIVSKEKDKFIKERLKNYFLSDEKKQEISYIYLNYLKLMKNNLPKYEQFYGMRDFYSMVKLLCLQSLYSIKNSINGSFKDIKKNQVQQKIIFSYMRHFSGLEESQNLLIEAINIKCASNEIPTQLQLIEDNLVEQSDYYISRNLMIIAKNPQFAQEYICRRLNYLNKPYKLLIGSDFRDDQNTENSHQIINQIISCVESGIIIVIQNLDKIYQSLYELLNQNFRHFNGKTYCKISFGADNSNIEIKPEFKLILLVDHSQIHRMDGPLLNRFEKHHLEENMDINEEEKSKVQKITNFLRQDKLDEQFSFSNLKEVVQSLLIQQRDTSHSYFKNRDIVQAMYDLSSFSQCLKNNINSHQVYKNNYFDSNQHYNLKIFIENLLASAQNKFSQSQQLITIYSHSFYLYEEVPFVKQKILLSDIYSQQSLIDKITIFFKDQNKSSNMEYDDPQYQILLVIADLAYDSYDRIIYSRQKIQEVLLEQRLKQNMCQNKYVIMIVRSNDQQKMLPFCGEWDQYFIDDLFPLSFINNSDIRNQFDLYNMFQNKNQSFTKIISISNVLEYFITNSENITNSYKNIKYQQINAENYLTNRLAHLWELFCNKNELLKPLISLFLRVVKEKIEIYLSSLGIFTINDFFENLIIRRGYLNQTSSLSNDVWNCFNQIISHNFSFIIYILEKYNMIYSLFIGKNNQFIIKYATEKLLNLFQLDQEKYDFINGLYDGEINIKNLKWNYELEQNSQDLNFFESKELYQVIESITNKIQISDTTINDEQDKNKLNQFKYLTDQIQNNFTDNQIYALNQFGDLFQKDYYIIFKQSISYQQQMILDSLAESHYYSGYQQNQLQPQKQKFQQNQLLLHILLSHFYKSDLAKIDIIMNVFDWILDQKTIFNNFQSENKLKKNKENKEKSGLRQFQITLIITIFNLIQPSHKIFKKVESFNIDLQQCIQLLIQYINYYKFSDINIVQVQQSLTLYSSFLTEIVSEFSININELASLDLQMIKELNEQYFEDFKAKLKKQYQIIQQNRNEKKQDQQMMQINQIDKTSEFDEKWNKFVLEIALNSLKSNQQVFSSIFSKSLFNLLGSVEKSYLKNKIKIPDVVLIKFNLIACEFVSSIKTEQDLIDIFENDRFQSLVQENQTEQAYLVIFSNSLQQLIIKPQMNNTSSNTLVKLIYTQKLNNLTAMQKLIYLSIFKEIIYQLLNKIDKQGNMQNYDENLKLFLDNLQESYLQIYVSKQFYNIYKQEDIIDQQMKKSPYFRDNKWIHQYIQGFFGLLSSSFLKQQELDDFKNQFENKGNYFKTQLKQYLISHIKQSNNVFGEISRGNMNKNQFYPFMMNNNIDILNIDSYNNTQLYQCQNCSEFIFSNECPNLTSELPCQQCGYKLAKGDGNIKQVLQHANRNILELTNINQSNMWQGFYISLTNVQSDYKIDQGTAVHLRIFSLLYFYSFMIAYEFNQKYTNYIDISPYSLKKKENYMAKTQLINQLLRINFEAKPLEFINEQINKSLSHLIENMQTIYNIREGDSLIIIFKIINSLLSNQSIQSVNSIEERKKLNEKLSVEIESIIKHSQNVILESNTKYKLQILEQQAVTDKEIQENYLNNLRTTDIKTSPLQIKAQIIQSVRNNEFLVFKEFLDFPRIAYISNSLKHLISFTQMMNQTLQKELTRKRAQEITLLEALNNDRSHPIYVYYLDYLIPTWKQIKEKEVEYQIQCQSHTIEQIDEKTKLNNLLFSEDKTFGYFPNILEKICNYQNNLLLKIQQLSLTDKSLQSQRLAKIIKNIIVNPSNNSLKTLPIQSVDVVLNIFKQIEPEIFIHYYMCNIYYSNGTKHIYDINLLQEELVNQSMSGCVQIDLKSSQQFQFLSDINQIGLLSDILIDQEIIPELTLKTIATLLQNKTQSYELLQQLSTVFQMFKKEKGLRHISLKQALDQIQIRQKVSSLENVLTELKLVHLNSFINFLEDLNMESLVELCNPVYKCEIRQILVENVISFTKQTVGLENFVNALGKFILRCLCQEQEYISATCNLFEQLFDIDTYEEIWKNISNVRNSYKQSTKIKVSISQSYDLFLKTKKVLNYEKSEQTKKANNLDNKNNDSNNSNNMVMENFTDKGIMKSIKNLFFKKS